MDLKIPLLCLTGYNELGPGSDFACILIILLCVVIIKVLY